MRRRATVLLVATLLALAPVAGRAAGGAGWQRVETEHFLLVYDSRDSREAGEILGFCEEVYDRVTAFFGAEPVRRAKIPCVLYGNADYVSGSMNVFPGRIEVFVTPPSDHSMGPWSESWLRVVFTHELTHFVQLGMDRGPFAAASKLFGADVAMGSAIFLPGWMVEGAAVNLETLLTRGGRGRSALFELHAKAPVLEGDLFSLRQAGYDSAFPPEGRIYVAGHVLLDHVLTEYGPDALARIMEAYLPFPFFGPWAAIEKVTGKKATAVYADMVQALADRHGGGPAQAPGTAVTPEAAGDWRRPQPTARGLYLYRSSPDRAPAIVRWDAAAGKEEVLARVALADHASFSATPDGNTIWFASRTWDWRKPGNPDAVSDLHVLDVPSRRLRRVTRGASVWQPAVSPDGSRVAAVQGRGRESRLVAVDPRDGSVTELYAAPGATVHSPAFSPDGRSLVFTVNEGGYRDIRLLRLEDGVPARSRLLTGPDASGEYFPSFLDGERLLFSSDRTGSLCLYSVHTGSGSLARVLEDPVAAISAVAAGGSLVYESYRTGGFCLREVAMDQLEARPVPPLPAQEMPAPPAAPLPSAQPPAAPRPYHDVPLPYAWYPWLPFTVSPATALDVGLGAQALGGSLLGITSWSIGLAWHPASAQPRAEVAVSTAIGNLRVDAGATLGYVGGLLPGEDVGASLLLTLPLAWRHELGRGLGVFARTRLVFDASLDRAVPFGFGDVLAAPAGDWDRSLWIVPGLAARWAAAGPALELFPTRAAEASVDLAALLPAFPGSAPPQRLLAYAAASVPSPVPHHALKLGARATWTSGATGASVDRFTAPRGSFAPVPRVGPGVVLASVDYLAPLALLDVPVVLGLGLTGLGIGAHVEWAAEVSAAPPALRPDAELFAGLEAVFQFTAGIQPFPVGIGLAARISTAGRPFDPSADLRPYLFFSADSLADAARARPGAP